LPFNLRPHGVERSLRLNSLRGTFPHVSERKIHPLSRLVFSGDREVVKRLIEPLFAHRESATVHADASLDTEVLVYLHRFEKSRKTQETAPKE
jgi:hypothetical protein